MTSARRKDCRKGSMASSADKYAVYKIAPPLERSKRSLTQGKLSSSVRSTNEHNKGIHTTTPFDGRHSYQSPGYSPVHSYLERNSEVRNDPASSPRRPPLPHVTGYPTSDHTHSLSLSDSDSPPHSSQTHHTHTPTAVIPQSSTECVLVVSAENSSPSHSHSVKTTTTNIVSPVKVIQHFSNDTETFNTDISTIHPPDTNSQEDWRRFSTNFVSLPPPPCGETKSEQRGHHREPGTLTGVQGSTKTQSKLHFKSQASGSRTQTHDTHTTCMSHDPTDQSDSGNLSTIAEDSLDNSELSALADVTHDRGVDRVRGEGGVGRSSSDQALRRVKLQNESIHSRSVDSSTLTATKKKTKKGRQVASRYMSEMSSVKKPPLSQSSLAERSKATPAHKTSHMTAKKSNTTSKRSSGAHKSGTNKSSKHPPLPARASHNTHTHTHLSTPSQHPSSALSMTFTPSGMVTSTPAHPYGSVHDGSFLAMDTTTSTAGNKTTERKKLTYGANKVSEGKVSEEEYDIMLTRLLQSTRLNQMSAQSLREQEKEAKNQLYTMWKSVEDKKQEKHELMKALETESRMLALENTMDVQLQGLGPVCVSLPQLEQGYATMARALDATRHDLTLRGVQPVDEDQLIDQLAESEEILGDIMTLLGTKVQTVSSFAETTDAVVNTLKKEHTQLDKCWTSLEEVTKLQLHETSLFLDKKQRTEHNKQEERINS